MHAVARLVHDTAARRSHWLPTAYNAPALPFKSTPPTPKHPPPPHHPCHPPCLLQRSQLSICEPHSRQCCSCQAGRPASAAAGAETAAAAPPPRQAAFAVKWVARGARRAACTSPLYTSRMYMPVASTPSCGVVCCCSASMKHCIKHPPMHPRMGTGSRGAGGAGAARVLYRHRHM